MSWSNHGEWHIDHKVPLAHFNHSKKPTALAWHFINLQPLGAVDNRRKNDHYDVGVHAEVLVSVARC